jgi:hypothetical protein
MGLTVDKPELLAALDQTDLDIRAQQEQSQGMLRALDSLSSDVSLTGQAWGAVKRRASDEIKPQVRRVIAMGDRVIADNQTFRAYLEQYIEDDYVQEDGLADCVQRMRNNDNLLREAIGLIPGDDDTGLKGIMDRMLWNSQQKVNRLEDKIRRLHALEDATKNLYQDVDQPQPITDVRSNGNAVMTKLVNAKMSEADIAKAFRDEFGMSKKQAEELADFTIRFRKYAKKRGWKGKDELYWYANMMAAVTGNYRVFPWNIAAGTMSDKELMNILQDKTIGYTEKEARVFIDHMECLHEGEDEKGRPLKNMKVDFIHEMGSLACILHTGKDADTYHSLTKGAAADGNPLHTTSWYRESATWGGDIASGSFGPGDMPSDMDAIILADLAERHPNQDPIELMTKYNRKISDDQDKDGYSRKRVDDFLRYYGRTYGDNSIESGRKFLQDHAKSIANSPIGNQGLSDKHNLKHPIQGPKDIKEAEKKFLESINGKKWKKDQ